MIPQEYIGSIAFDWRLAPYDIEGSIVHVNMLARTGILTQSDARKIERGLIAIGKDIARGWQLPPAEDIHFAIETELIKRIGEVGKRMHTARSRNDQVALDLKLYVRDYTQKIIAEIVRVQSAIYSLAQQHRETLIPGFTHLQHGQPVFFAHHVLAYGWMLERDKSRFRDNLNRLDSSPLGSCAMAGTAFPIDRQWAAKQLGFSKPSENSMDGVSDRDFAVDFVYAAAMAMTHLSRMAEEWVIWSSSEFNYVQLAEEYTSGSSIMPQKRNPDTAELLRGKTSRTLGGLMHLLSLMKNLTLTYNRDLQEDKPPVFDAAETILASLEVAGGIWSTLKVHEQAMESASLSGFLLATELADYLARKGMPFRKAHEIIHRLVGDLRKQGRASDQDLSQMPLAVLQSYSPLFQSDVHNVLSIRKAASSRNSIGGTGSKALRRQLQEFAKHCLKKR